MTINCLKLIFSVIQIISRINEKKSVYNQMEKITVNEILFNFLLKLN